MSVNPTITRLAAAFGVAAAITLGLTATPAQAATPGVLEARLFIQGGGGSDCTIYAGERQSFVIFV